MTSVFATTLGPFKWILQHWYIPLVALAAVLAWIVSRRNQSPSEAVIDELAAIKRANRLDKIAADNKAEIANALADDQYRSVLLRLDAKQRIKAENLRRHPGRRLLYLRRLAKRIEQRDRAARKRYSP